MAILSGRSTNSAPFFYSSKHLDKRCDDASNDNEHGADADNKAILQLFEALVQILPGHKLLTQEVSDNARLNLRLLFGEATALSFLTFSWVSNVSV
jgi:hypothetical protein